MHIPLPTARATLLKQQMTDVATVIIKRQIVASDAVPLPQTALAGGFDALRTTIVAALDPALTTPRLANHRITGLSTAQAAGLSDIMAAPDLSEPTYQALAAISQDWLSARHRHAARRAPRRWSNLTARSSARSWWG